MTDKPDIDLGRRWSNEFSGDLELADKQRAAIHEAGQLVVAALLGGIAHAHIESIGAADPLEEGAWEGSCDVAMGPADVAEPCLEIVIAGEAAVCLHENPAAACDEMLELLGLCENESPGTGSLALAASPRQKHMAVDNVLAMLRDFRPAVDWAAQQMVSGALVVGQCDGAGLERALHVQTEQYVLGSVSESGAQRRLKLTAEWTEAAID